jgi:hypothetical protein
MAVTSTSTINVKLGSPLSVKAQSYNDGDQMVKDTFMWNTSDDTVFTVTPKGALYTTDGTNKYGPIAVITPVGIGTGATLTITSKASATNQTVTINVYDDTVTQVAVSLN